MRVVLAALFLSIRRVQRQRRPDHRGRAAATGAGSESSSCS